MGTELSRLTEEELLQHIESSERAISSCGDSEHGHDYALAALFRGRDKDLDDLARIKRIQRSEAYSIYKAWAESKK